MKKVIQLLTPPFVKQFDTYLLEKHPFLWSKRFAQVLFFGLVILGFNVALCSISPVSIFSYIPMWVFIWFLTVPSVLFLLVWLFFQYKYDLAWDYSKLGWGYYFKTGLAYTLVCTFCLLLVVIPASIYQYRVNTYYDNSISMDRVEEDDNSRSISGTYFNSYYSSRNDLSGLRAGTDEYEEIRENIINMLFDKIDDFSDLPDYDSIIKPGIEELYLGEHTFLTLNQFGDSMERYPGTHVWMLDMISEKKTGKDPGFLEARLRMFSPSKYYYHNTEEILKVFDSSDYYFQEFFTSGYLRSERFPDPDSIDEFNWEPILFDPLYHIESQRVRFYDKKATAFLKDQRLNKVYPKFVFTTDLIDQGKKKREYFIGATIRGQNKLFDPDEFYELKRLEYFLRKRFNVESLDHLTREFVSAHIVEFQQMGRVIKDLERDYGSEFTRYSFEETMVYLIIIYVCSAILALILLTIRLLNFRLLVISVISLTILSFIVFVPLIGFNIDPFDDPGAFIFLSFLYAFLTGSVIRVNLAESVSRFMTISALAGLIVLPLITIFYFGFILETMDFDYLEEEKILKTWGVGIFILFLIGHIPLMSRTIHKAFYLPKK